MSEFWKRELIKWYGAVPIGTLVALGIDRVFIELNAQHGHAAGYSFLALVAAYAASSMWLGAKQKVARNSAAPA